MEVELFEFLAMAFLNELQRLVMHKVSGFIKSKFFRQDFISREKYLDKVDKFYKLPHNIEIYSMQLRVLHKSSNFLLVNKHPDLVFNTNPPDTRSDCIPPATHWYVPLGSLSTSRSVSSSRSLSSPISSTGSTWPTGWTTPRYRVLSSLFWPQ